MTAGDGDEVAEAELPVCRQRSCHLVVARPGQPLGDLNGINSYHSRVRQRFSIAHEIGHARLHVSDGKDKLFVDPPARQLFRDADGSLGEDTREVQANQ